MSISPQQLEALREAIDEDWITVEEWCKRTGDSVDAIYARRTRGVWQDGVHANKPKGGGLWINRREAAKWAAGRNVLPKVSMPGQGDPANEASASSSGSGASPAASR